MLITRAPLPTLRLHLPQPECVPAHPVQVNPSGRPQALGVEEVRPRPQPLNQGAAMPPTRESSRSSLPRRRPRRAAATLAGAVLGLLMLAGSALAAPAPSVPAGFTITKIAAPAPAGASNCDDLAFLDGHLFMGCQNK